MLPSYVDWDNNRQLTDQSNSHQFSELVECVHMQVDPVMFKILGLRGRDFISQKIESTSWFFGVVSCLDLYMN